MRLSDRKTSSMSSKSCSMPTAKKSRSFRAAQVRACAVRSCRSTGGIILDMKGMNRILEINPQDGYCRVEPGVVDDDLNRALKPYGVFYPPTPASSCVATIGGEIANNASGGRSVKYGAARDAILSMKVVMPNGDYLSFGSSTRVAASGYPLERLMVGSEGTLAVIVEACMRFVPIPKLRCLGIAKFNTYWPRPAMRSPKSWAAAVNPRCSNSSTKSPSSPRIKRQISVCRKSKRSCFLKPTV